VAESQAQAEDELTAALLETRHHMVHARATLNPPDYEVDVSRVNPWNDPRVADDVGVRYSLENATLYAPRRGWPSRSPSSVTPACVTSCAR